MFDVEEKKGRENRQADIKGEFISLFPFCIDPGKRLLAYVMDVGNLTWSPLDSMWLFDFTSFPSLHSSPVRSFQWNHPAIDQPYQPLEHTLAHPFDLLYRVSLDLLIVHGLSLKYPCRGPNFPSEPFFTLEFLSLSFSLSVPFSASSEWYLDATKTFVSCSAG